MNIEVRAKTLKEFVGFAEAQGGIDYIKFQKDKQIIVPDLVGFGGYSEWRRKARGHRTRAERVCLEFTDWYLLERGINMFKYYDKETKDCFILMLNNLSFYEICKERNYNADMYQRIWKNIKYINKQKDKRKYFNKMVMGE